jgi:hypothetical protein
MVLGHPAKAETPRSIFQNTFVDDNFFAEERKTPLQQASRQVA